jgi:hypothetical protein
MFRTVAGVHDPELFALTERTLREAVAIIRRVTEERGWTSTFHEFPEFSDPFRSGFPHIIASQSEVPKYTDVIGVRRGRFSPLGYDDIPTFADLFEYASANERLSAYLGLKAGVEPAHGLDFARITVAQIFFGLLEHLLHLHGFDFTTAQLLERYVEVENGLFEDRLPIEIVVPVALTPFEFDGSIDIGDNLAIERMADDWQLARMPASQTGAGAAANSAVISAATHAFVFRGWTMPNGSAHVDRTDRLAWYPQERIDSAFAALRIATGVRTGYAQLSIRPVGWALRWKAHLPPTGGGALVRRYPPAFDDWGWLQDPPPPITDEQARKAGELEALLAAAPSKLQLGARRYLGAGLREVEEDAAIDLCIGLEATLGDESPTEITHKLALRTAAVLGAEGDDPATVFGDVRAMYRHRSAIVHGTAPEKTRLIRREDGAEIVVSELASDYLRRTIRALLRNPDWRTPSSIDNRLLLRPIRITTDDPQP